MTSIRAWYIPVLHGRTLLPFTCKIRRSRTSENTFQEIIVRELDWIHRSVSTHLSDFIYPMCCVHFNPIARVNHCNKTIIILHLSLFLFVQLYMCTYLSTLLSHTSTLYIHLFLPTQTQKTCDSTVTKPPVISSYNTMTNILKTLGNNQVVLTHSKLNKRLCFFQLLSLFLIALVLA